MMARLFMLELRNLSRSPRGRATFVLLALLSASSVFFGQKIRSQHEELGVRDELASRRKISAAETASSTVTAFDLAAWSDSFVARGTTGASSLVAADLQSLPDSAALRIFDPPVLVPSFAERSPAAILLGTLDLAWLLALLAPLAAIALGFDAIARDRERGTLAMLLAPAPSRTPLLTARAGAIAVILYLGTVPAALLAGSLPAVVLLAAYALFLAASVIAASALSQRAATSLTVLIAGWLVISVAIPLGTAAIVRTSYPLPHPRAKLDGEQAAADVFQKPSAATIDREAERDPALDPSKGTDGISVQNRYYLLLSRERLRVAKGARFAEDRVLRERAELAEIAGYLSPSTIVAAALSELAATGPTERIDFTLDAELYRTRMDNFVRERVLANETKIQRAEEWPRFSRPERASAHAVWIATAIFVLLAAMLFGFTAVRFESMELNPTREDA